MYVFIRDPNDVQTFIANGPEGLMSFCESGLSEIWDIGELLAFSLHITTEKPQGAALRAELFFPTDNPEELSAELPKHAEHYIPGDLDDVLRSLGLYKPGVVYVQLEVLQ